MTRRKAAETFLNKIPLTARRASATAAGQENLYRCMLMEMDIFKGSWTILNLFLALLIQHLK